MTRCLDCPALIHRGRSRCGPCATVHEAKRMARRAPNGWDLQRRNKATIAAANGRCAICGHTATEVDHAVPLQHGGSNDESNRRALCRRCHLAVTR